MTQQAITIPRVVIASAGTGQGTTTAALALANLLRERELRVAPFKIGDDVFDPYLLGAAVGRPARNLDGALLPEPGLLALFGRAVRGDNEADIALIEGAGGLYDPSDRRRGEISTADVAKMLGAPVLLVLDVSGSGRTTAAIVDGLRRYDERLPIGGLLLNRIQDREHLDACRTALRPLGVPILGWIPDGAPFATPERAPIPLPERPLRLAGDRLERSIAGSIDVAAILALARTAEPTVGVPPLVPVEAAGDHQAVVAIADDAAFGFYRGENLDVLRDLGAELRPFSPLHDERLPDGCGAVYLSGALPERHAGALFINLPIRRAIREHAEAGLPILAEAGALMYLCQQLVGLDGARHRMVGIVPAVGRETEDVTVGRREVVSLCDTAVTLEGQRLTGHLFHRSLLQDLRARPALRELEGDSIHGVAAGPRSNVLATGLRLSFANDPRLAQRFIHSAARQEEAE